MCPAFTRTQPVVLLVKSARDCSVATLMGPRLHASHRVDFMLGVGMVRNKMPFMTVEQQIRSEIYKVLEALGADRKLLPTVGSWGDTLEDEEVLQLLKKWNAGRLDGDN